MQPPGQEQRRRPQAGAQHRSPPAGEHQQQDQADQAEEQAAALREGQGGTADSLPEVAGEAAVLVPPGRPDRLAEALARLLDDPAERRRLREAGPARARSFDRRTALAAYRDLYARVLASS